MDTGFIQLFNSYAIYPPEADKRVALPSTFWQYYQKASSGGFEVQYNKTIDFMRSSAKLAK